MDWIMIIGVAMGLWNLVVFILYGIDKSKAKNNYWRISEKTLLLAAALMGGIGALLGMLVFHHKTKHLKFSLGVPLLLILNIAVGMFCVWRVDMISWDKPTTYTRITAEEAKSMIDNETTVILDVRTDAEYNESHIEDAVLLPYDEISQRAGAVLPNKNALILIYCRSGRRSEIAARELIDMGYRKVYDFGGIIDWTY